MWQIETQIKKMRGTAPGKELQHHFSASDALMGKGPFDPTRKYSHYNFDNMAARPAHNPFRVSVCAVRTLNATGQSRVTVSPR